MLIGQFSLLGVEPTLSDTVSLALTDGGTASATRHFTVNVPTGHVYWPNQLTGTIGRADLNGQNPNQSFITGAFNPFGVAVGSG